MTFISVFFITSICLGQHTYTEYLNHLDYFESNYSNKCKIETYLSEDNKTIAFLKISDQVYNSSDKKQVLFIASTHGDEKQPYLMAIRLVDFLLSNFDKNTVVTNLLLRAEVIICPVLNPDGYFEYNSGSRFNANFIDINRNFPFRSILHPDGNETQSETSAVIDIISKNPEIIACIDLHTGKEYVAYPWFGINEVGNTTNINLANQYRNLVKENAPNTYMEDNSSAIHGYITNEDPDNQKQGTFNDYISYHEKFGITIEMNEDKSSLNIEDLWNYSFKSLIQFVLSSCDLNINSNSVTVINNDSWQSDRYTVDGNILVGDNYSSIDPLTGADEKFLLASSSIKLTKGVYINNTKFHAQVGPTQYDDAVIKSSETENDQILTNSTREGIIKIYPNPNDGVFTLTCESAISVQIFSASGALIYEDQLSAEENIIDISNHRSGIYILKLKSEFYTAVEKVIVR